MEPQDSIVNFTHRTKHYEKYKRLYASIKWLTTCPYEWSLVCLCYWYTKSIRPLRNNPPVIVEFYVHNLTDEYARALHVVTVNKNKLPEVYEWILLVYPGTEIYEYIRLVPKLHPNSTSRFNWSITGRHRNINIQNVYTIYVETVSSRRESVFMTSDHQIML